MSILINKKTRVVVQDILSKRGSFHAQLSLQYGTQIVAGVNVGHGGKQHVGVPLFNTVHEAVDKTEVDASVIYVPPAMAADAIIEAADAGIKLIVCVTEGIPVHDMLRVKVVLSRYDTRLIGPNSPGIITPGECLMGVMPANAYQPGRIGILSRSGTLIYEAALQTTQCELGQSTCVAIGADPVHGMSFVDCLALFEADRKTKGIILMGEMGGYAEEDAAAFIKATVRKPVIAYVAGTSVARPVEYGHAYSLVSQNKGTAVGKCSALEFAGVKIVHSITEIGSTMLNLFEG